MGRYSIGERPCHFPFRKCADGGSVRRISVFPAPAFEETVIPFESGKFMEYSVTKGNPIKNHAGRLVFTDGNAAPC